MRSVLDALVYANASIPAKVEHPLHRVEILLSSDYLRLAFVLRLIRRCGMHARRTQLLLDIAGTVFAKIAVDINF